MNLPFFAFELPPLAFLVLLFEVEEFTMAVTLPLELVFDIVADDLDAFAFAFVLGLFATDCIFDTV